MTSRETVREIFYSALKSISPESIMCRNVVRMADDLQVQGVSYSLAGYDHVHICGSGKAAARMALALEKLLWDRLAGGIVVTSESGCRSDKLTFLASSHPIPTEKSLSAAEALSDYLSRLSRNDLCIYLLSGGSSSLVEKPLPPVTLSDFQSLSSMLLKSGMRIAEMNTIRKHLSSVKGGRLGVMSKGRIIVLVISDVIGDDLEAIGSGPLYSDRSTYLDARSILERYALWEQVPDSIRRVIEDGIAGRIGETVKTTPDHVHHYLLGSNMKFLEAAKIKTEALGIHAHIMTSSLCGEAGEVAKVLVALAREIGKTGNPFPPPVCLLFGGETTVTVTGTGTGGRNQQLCLSFLAEHPFPVKCTLLSAGSDGIDGNSDAAGAIVDGETITRMNRLGLNSDSYLRQNDAYHFFKQTDDLLFTGPTGTNVMDMQILYIEG